MRRGPEFGGFEGDRFDRSAEEVAQDAFREYMAEDTPGETWHDAVEKQVDPVKVGALTAVGFAALMVFDVVQNGPSGFVVNHPEAATTALTGGAAAIGALASKLVRDENARQVTEARRAERERRRHD